MSLLSTLVACCGSSNGSSSVSKKDTKTLVVGLVRENKIGRSGRIDGRSGRQAVQWRPTLCTISEEDVIKAEMIQVFVMPCKKNTGVMSRHNFKPSRYKKEFV
ncbi:hypothetical protein R6Q57_027718 [Mikania cordata]